jgi:hypothetical protein
MGYSRSSKISNKTGVASWPAVEWYQIAVAILRRSR